MKIVLQRVKSASVKTSGKTVANIGKGFLLLTGIGPDDTIDNLSKAAKKISGLRIFEDEKGKMNLDLKQIGGEILAVSNFTLYADCRKGNRPSFANAAAPDYALKMFDKFANELRNRGFKVQTGTFGEHMDVEMVNWGPVTILLEF